MSGAGRGRAGLTLGVLLGLSSGCALMSKGDALYPRYFSPEYAASPRASKLPAAGPLSLRLGQVQGASYVEERFAYRSEPTELSYYEERRWTEPPERYLRRALERELFQQRGIRRTISGPGSTLDVELTAFEELRGTPQRVRVTLSFSLHDERKSQLERRVVVERPLPPHAPQASARDVTTALGLALTAAVLDVSDQVTRELEAPLSQPDPCR